MTNTDFDVNNLTSIIVNLLFNMRDKGGGVLQL